MPGKHLIKGDDYRCHHRNGNKPDLYWIQIVCISVAGLQIKRFRVKIIKIIRIVCNSNLLTSSPDIPKKGSALL